MQWAPRVTVALLNVAWILFFLHPDPLSLSVQRRSSDEDILFEEFCIHPRSDIIWTPAVHSVNSSNTTDAAIGNLTLLDVNSNMSEIPRDCQCKNTKVPRKDLFSSQLPQIDIRPPAPGCEAMIFMKFPSTEVCIDKEKYLSAISPLVSDWNETTPASPTEGATASGVFTQSTSTVQSRHISGRPNKDGCCLRFYSGVIPSRLIKGYRVQTPMMVCPVNAIVLYTVRGAVCGNPETEWVRRWFVERKKAEVGFVDTGR